MQESIPSTLNPVSEVRGNAIAKVVNGSQRQLEMGVKRVLDVSVALGFLIMFSPLLIGVAVLLLVTQGRPILFNHRRIGKNGEVFHCLKFRTMVNDAAAALETYFSAHPHARHEWEKTHKLQNDPRVTPLGRIFRKLSIDELPQLINVLIGEMSLVGPRPIVSAEARFYGSHISDYESFRPGMTGPWQVSGRSSTSYARRVQLDVEYVRNWSLAKDVVILAKTVPAVLSSNGSC